jgi:hypothetical protein
VDGRSTGGGAVARRNPTTLAQRPIRAAADPALTDPPFDARNDPFAWRRRRSVRRGRRDITSSDPEGEQGIGRRPTRVRLGFEARDGPRENASISAACWLQT